MSHHNRPPALFHYDDSLCFVGSLSWISIPLLPASMSLSVREISCSRWVSAHPRQSSIIDTNLILDGGGVRGLASLIILEKLMWTINDIASDRGIAGPLLPGDVFCLLVGTSTGGLIATMLGRLNMSVSDCIHAYRNSASKIFGKPNKTGKWSLGFLKARYDGRILHDIVREYACGRRQNPNLSMIRQNYDHEEDASKW